MYNFIDSCLLGNALLEDIDDFIDQWHDSDSQEPLYKYLGMSEREYSWWLIKPEILPFIVTAHREKIDTKEVFSRELSSMAARSAGVDKAIEIKQWLQQRGKWEY